MFGSLGMPELVIIFVIALIVFGPRKLPELGKSLGKSLAEFKRASNELRNSLEEEIRVEEERERAKAAPAPVAATAVGVTRRAVTGTASGRTLGRRTLRSRPGRRRASRSPRRRRAARTCKPVRPAHASRMSLSPVPSAPPPPRPFDDDEEDEGVGGKMSFLEHLDELRQRLIRALAGVFVGFCISIVFIEPHLRLHHEAAAGHPAGGRQAHLHRADRGLHAVHEDGGAGGPAAGSCRC